MFSFSPENNRIKIHWTAPTKESADRTFKKLKEKYSPSLYFEHYSAKKVDVYKMSGIRDGFEYHCSCYIWIDALMHLIKV